MSVLVPYLLLVGGLAAVMGGFAWLAVVIRRRGVAGSAMRAAMASYDEAFRVTAHESYYEVRAQADRGEPGGAPGDPWRRRLRLQFLRRH
jgi:hypothetical protein